ncbi:MAG: PKD domain-containing protein [Thermoplasmata archaeon]|nr:PKD domain-containing protein [Thermoplasmata archaeon]
MEGMGHTHRGPSITLVTAVTALTILAIAVLVMASDAEAEETDRPDLLVGGITNITEVYQGDDTFFNVTIKNIGDEAYLVRTSGDLEVFGYIDKPTDVSGHTMVYQDIYRRTNVIINLKVNFGTVGNHTLRVVLDPSGKINESDETNNEMTVNVTVWESNENRPPEADGGNDRIGYLDEPVFFSARYSEDPDDDPLTYSWVFGDGGEGTSRFTNHTYIYEGQYGVSLIVSDGEKIDIDTFTVTIIEAPTNHPPTATISIGNDKVNEGEDLTMDGRLSSDPNLDTLTYDWDFDASDGVDDWVRGAVVVHSWDEKGVYQVTLQVSDGKETDTATTLITVLEPPPPNQTPKANAGNDTIAIKGKEIEVMGKGSDPDGHIVSWEWDIDNDGTYDTYSETSGTLVITFDEVGLKTLWLRVTDNRGGMSKESVIITVEKADDNGGESPGPGIIAAICAFALIYILSRQGPLGGPGGGTKNEKDELTIK